MQIDCMIRGHAIRSTIWPANQYCGVHCNAYNTHSQDRSAIYVCLHSMFEVCFNMTIRTWIVWPLESFYMLLRINWMDSFHLKICHSRIISLPHVSKFKSSEMSQFTVMHFTGYQKCAFFPFFLKSSPPPFSHIKLCRCSCECIHSKGIWHAEGTVKLGQRHTLQVCRVVLLQQVCGVENGKANTVCIDCVPLREPQLLLWPPLPSCVVPSIAPCRWSWWSTSVNSCSSS